MTWPGAQAAAEKRRRLWLPYPASRLYGVLPRHGGEAGFSQSGCGSSMENGPYLAFYGMRKGRQDRPYYRKELTKKPMFVQPKLYLCPNPHRKHGGYDAARPQVLRSAIGYTAEDTRNTGALLSRLGISTPAIATSTTRVAGRRDAGRVAGEAIAFVSDAGLPGISDPGSGWWRAFIRKAALEVLPGPSASLTALVLSGLPAKEACFVGFCPHRQGAPGGRRPSGTA